MYILILYFLFTYYYGKILWQGLCRKFVYYKRTFYFYEKNLINNNAYKKNNLIFSIFQLMMNELFSTVANRKFVKMALFPKAGTQLRTLKKKSCCTSKHKNLHTKFLQPEIYWYEETVMKRSLLALFPTTGAPVEILKKKFSGYILYYQKH